MFKNLIICYIIKYKFVRFFKIFQVILTIKK